jgi:hypothetical protein
LSAGRGETPMTISRPISRPPAPVGVAQTAVLVLLSLATSSCNLVAGDGNYIVVHDWGREGVAAGDCAADGGSMTRDAGALSTGDALADAGVDTLTNDALADAGVDTLANDARSNVAIDALTKDALTNSSLTNDADAFATPLSDSGDRDSGPALSDASRVDATSGADAKSGATCRGACVEVYSKSQVELPMTGELVVPFQLRNTGMMPINLSGVTIRYYFSSEGCNLGGFGGRCDESQLNHQNVPCPGARVVPLVPPRPSADAYIEISFGDVVLPPTPVPIYQASGASFPFGHECTFLQLNDYSYDMKAANFGLAPNITAYVNGTLVWGTEP